MPDSSSKGKRVAWFAMYYLPLPWALYYTVMLIPLPTDKGWRLLYYSFPSRSYWIAYSVLLGAFGILSWSMRRPGVRAASSRWRDFLVAIFWGYVIAVAGLMGWLLVLGLCGFVTAVGEDAVFAVLALLCVPPLWSPVIGAFLLRRTNTGRRR